MQQATTHPEWGESDLDAWVTTTGGRTTVTGVAPSEVQDSTTRSWRGVLGANVATGTPAFRWKAPPDQKGVARIPSTGNPAWTVSATATAANGATLRYVLEYEPFGGRLVAVSRQ